MLILILVNFYGANLMIQGTRGYKNDSSLFAQGIVSQYSFLNNGNLYAGLAITPWFHTDFSVLILSAKGNFDKDFDVQPKTKELFAEIYWNIFSLTIGKKIIKKGTGYLKNPSNLFDKKETQDPEDKRNIYLGDWLGSLKLILGSENSFNFITAKNLNQNLLSINTLLLNSDIELGIGHDEKEFLLACALSRVFGSIEFHLDNGYYIDHLVVEQDTQKRKDGTVCLAGVSYGHGGPLLIIGEYLYNGLGYNDEIWQSYWQSLKMGDSIAVSLYQPPFMRQNYLFLMFRLQNLQIVPTLYSLWCLDDQSSFLSLSIEYSFSHLSTELECTKFFATSSSEFGSVPFRGSITMRLKWQLGA
ncbi:MAG: hypothetical protein ACUVTF_05975 [bacterium]